MSDHVVARLAVALGVGLLVGIERERKKGRGPSREPAGVRTFTLASLTGAVAVTVGGELTLVALLCIVGLLLVAGYRRARGDDPGLTTEIALITTFLLGAWAMREPVTAAGVAVVITIVLASRTRLHRWVRDVLTDQEVHDGLALAAAALVILPLTPREAIDPWGVIRPRTLWALAVLIMGVNAIGYVALRAMGARVGLAIAGLVSGFVSSTATVGAMASRAKSQPQLRRSAIAGAALSCVATAVELGFVLAVAGPATLKRAMPALLSIGVAAAAYGTLFAARGARETAAAELAPGRPFQPSTAIYLTALLGAALVVSALLTQRLGARGLLLAALVTGFADAHAAAISAASVAATGQASIASATLGVLVGFSANTASKIVVAFAMGDRGYAIALVPGLLLMAAVAWGAEFLVRTACVGACL